MMDYADDGGNGDNGKGDEVMIVVMMKMRMECHL